MLLVDKEFRITDDVDEKDMRDLDLNFLFNLGRHPVKLRENKAIHNSPSAVGRDESRPQEIADVAGLSLPTVKKHVHLIFRKLEVNSRDLLIALMRSGIVCDLLGSRSALKSAIRNLKSEIECPRSSPDRTRVS